LASLALALAGGAVPVAGIAFAVLTPLPLILLSARHGRTVALLAVAAIGTCLAALLGRQYAWVAVLEFGVPAVVLAEAIRREWSPERSVGVGSLAVVGGSVVAVLLVSRGAGSLVDGLLEHLDRAVQETLALYARMGVPQEESGPWAASPERLRRFLLDAAPALLIAPAVLVAAANYFLARTGLGRALATDRSTPACLWRMPEWLVWVFIASASLFLSGLPIPRQVGLNGLLVMIALYLIQGVAIAAFWVRRLQLPPLVWGIGVVLLLLQPLLLLFLAGLGLFDTWFAFRREPLSRPPGG
jgi:uncharacterized protein YybS (DUF2232 family)